MNQNLQPDFNSMALITIDTQKDTLDGQPLEIPGTTNALPQMLKVLQVFRQLKKPIVHIIRIYKPDGSNVDLCRRQAIQEGAKTLLAYQKGSELADELFPDQKINLSYDSLLQGKIQKISDHEIIIYKPRWGAFYQTPMEDYLSSLNINTLVFMGCNFPNCPRTSIFEASERDYKIVLLENALSGLYEKGKKEIENIGVLVLTAQEFIKKCYQER